MKLPLFLSCYFLCLLFFTLGCSQPVTLLPDQQGSSKPSVSDPNAETELHQISHSRFFCEDGLIHNTLLTFSDQASSTARPSRLYWNDPKRDSFLLTDIRHIQLFHHTDSSEWILFQASSLTGTIGESLRKTGIYFGVVSPLSRKTQTFFLKKAPLITADAQRVALNRGIRLRSFGVIPSSHQVILPVADGYTLFSITKEPIPQLGKEIGSFPCSPKECWNPEVHGSEVWFDTIDVNSGQLNVRGFALPESGSDTAREIPFQHSVNGARILSASDHPLLLELSHQSATLIFRNKSLQKRIDLMASEKNTDFQSISAIFALSGFTSSGGTVVLANNEALTFFRIDFEAGSAIFDGKISLPENSQLLRLLADHKGTLYANLKRFNGPRLYRLLPNMNDWEPLTQDSCEYPIFREAL